jgi:hypothetical protein
MSVEQIEKALQAAAEDGHLSCAAAFEVAAAFDLPAGEVGELADRLGLHLWRCQLGLFGYPPRKKIVIPLESVDEELAEAIRAGLENDRLPCRTAWAIAERLAIPRMQVSAACETLEIKIKPCQLGAF